MGFLKDLVGVAAPIAGSIFGGPVGSAIGGAIGGMVSGSGQPKSQTSTVQQQMDPRISQMLFGNGGADKGLLAQYQGMMGAPRSDAANSFANASGNYLIGNGPGDMGMARDAAIKAMQGNQAPMMQAAQSGGGGQSLGGFAALPAYSVGAMVDAPSQNDMDLSGSYNSLINGQAGNNPYLTGAIQKGINQSSSAFGNMLTDAKSATQDLLGNVRGGAIASGQYGSSRQGLAEGKAIDSFNTNVSRAASQFGQNNTDAAAAAQAGAYDADRNRQLSATQGLGAQQYGVAQQNANTQTQAEFMNVGNSFDASKTNANLYQNNNQFNASLGQNNNQFNAGLQQQGGLANQQSQLSTNAQNNGNNLAGAGLLSGLLGNASGQVNYNDGYALNQAQGVNSLLSPYLGGQRSGTSSQTDPLYSSTVGNAIGGAGMGSQLGSLFSGSGSSGGLSDLFGIGKSGGGLFGSGSYF